MSFLANLRQAQYQAGQQQLQGQARNAELDAISRNFFSNEIGVGVSDLREEVRKAYTEGQIDQATFSNFGFIGGGRAGATLDELYTIAELKFPEGTENAPEERDYYVTNYLNKIGAAAAHLGNNKGYSALNREGQFLTPDVMTWELNENQTYTAPMTLGGKPAGEGGAPASLDMNKYNSWLLNYQESIQRQAGKPISYGLAVAQLSADEPEGTYTPPENMGVGGAGTYAGGDNVIERTTRDVEAGAIPAVPGAGGGLSGAAGPTQTVGVDDAADGVPSQVYDYGIMDSSMTEILDTSQLDSAFSGTAKSARVGAATRIADRVRDADSQYTHDSTSDIHLGFNPDQWNSRTSTQQQDLTAQSIRVSNENIAKGMYSGPVENGVNTAALERISYDQLNMEATAAETTMRTPLAGAGVGRQGSGANVSDWEGRYGSFAPLDGMGKVETLRTVKDFYATPEGDPPDPEVGGTGTRTVEQTLQRFPEYYEEFKQLGAVEFAKKYYNNPDFLSHIPTVEKQEADIALGEDILDDFEKAFDVTVTPDGDIETANRGVIRSPGEAQPRQAGEMLSIQDIRLAEELQITTPEQSAVANTIAVLTQGDNADRPLAVSDLAHIPRRIRRIFAATAYADLPENERQRLLPVLNALAEYGILDTRLARITSPYQAASAINQAYSNDINMIRTQGAEFEQFESMRNTQIDRVIRMGQLALQERGQNIQAVGQQYDQWWRARQARWNNDSVVRGEHEDIEEAANAAVQWGLDASAEFDALPLTPHMQEEFGPQGNVLSPFTALRGESDLKKVSQDIFSPQHGAALQTLARRVSRAPNMASLAHMEPDIQAALHNIFRGMSSEHFRLDMMGGIQGGVAATLGVTAATGGVGAVAAPLAFVGGFALMQFDEALAAWKQAYLGTGADTESFNISGRMIAMGEDNLPIRDMSEIWNAKTGLGTRVKSFRMLGAMGQEEGKDIPPSVINSVFGTDLMDVILASAVLNANEFR